MFGVYFGKFLVDEGVLTNDKYKEIIDENRTARLKLGPLAVNEKFMTTAQAEEVNTLQAVKDQRFGDIAIEKGYLTKEQLEILLKKQADSYLLFTNAIIERNILSLEQLSQYINKFKQKENFSSFEFELLKSSDIDSIIHLYTNEPTCPVLIKDYVALFARNIVRFIDNKVRFEKIETTGQQAASCLAGQEMSGDYDFFIGICSDDKADGITKLASIYGKEEFDFANNDALDAICEFINVSNGLFATRLADNDITEDMMPPVMLDKTVTISSDNSIYKIPFFVYGKKVTLIICMDSKWSIE